jgi:hypothetical protein
MKKIIFLLAAALISVHQASPDVALSSGRRAKPTIIIPAPKCTVNGQENPGFGQNVALALVREVAKSPDLVLLQSVDPAQVDYSLVTFSTAAKSAGSTFKSGAFKNIFKLPFTNNVEITARQWSVEMDWQLVDNHSHVIVNSGHATGSSGSGNLKIEEMAAFGNDDSNAFADRALAKAAISAVGELARQVLALHISAPEAATPAVSRALPIGKIIFMEDEKIYISLGSDHGLVVGDRLMVYKCSGRVEGGKEINLELGELKIVHVGRTQSYGERIDNVAVKEGLTVAALGATLN